MLQTRSLEAQNRGRPDLSPPRAAESSASICFCAAERKSVAGLAPSSICFSGCLRESTRHDDLDVFIFAHIRCASSVSVSVIEAAAQNHQLHGTPSAHPFHPGLSRQRIRLNAPPFLSATLGSSCLSFSGWQPAIAARTHTTKPMISQLHFFHLHSSSVL